MKSLTNYVQDRQTKLFDDTGAFFAFSDAQFEEAKKPDTIYVDMGTGLICPKENAKTLAEGLVKIHKEGRAQDIEENGKEAIIKRELYNHECFYIGDYSDCVDALEGYGFTVEDIRQVYNTEYETACDMM